MIRLDRRSGDMCMHARSRCCYRPWAVLSMPERAGVSVLAGCARCKHGSNAKSKIKHHHARNMCQTCPGTEHVPEPASASKGRKGPKLPAGPMCTPRPNAACACPFHASEEERRLDKARLHFWGMPLWQPSCRHQCFWRHQLAWEGMSAVLCLSAAASSTKNMSAFGSATLSNAVRTCHSARLFMQYLHRMGWSTGSVCHGRAWSLLTWAAAVAGGEAGAQVAGLCSARQCGQAGVREATFNRQSRRGPAASAALQLDATT